LMMSNKTSKSSGPRFLAQMVSAKSSPILDMQLSDFKARICRTWVIDKAIRD
jgi:hypothetical protein